MPSRRTFLLQSAAAASALALPLRASAAVQDTGAVNSLPRFALVIGNGTYGSVPLPNAPNDAKGIADHLKRTSFDVTLKLDSTRADMIETIRAFGKRLAAQKGVGLFYFAGHGAQLGWRNYLIAVDAAIKTPDDMQSRAVDLETLLDSITREYSVGKKWSARYRFKARAGSESATEIDFKVADREKISVPAGEFDAFRIEGLGFSTRGFSLHYRYWVAPEQVRRVVVTEETFRNLKTNREFHAERHELVAFRQLR